MNMKKSIAGVAAGAMAISAMATVASANVNTHFLNEDATAEREQIVLTYDLATYVEAYKPTTVKIATTYQGAEYFIKGVQEDKINGGAGSSVGASDTGYTVILGNQINNNQWAMGNYYIQSVELQATSVDHGSGNANGINGVRSAEKIWYSRATLGKDLSDMQNKSAAVEDHEHLDVVRDGNNEYAFKVEFNELADAVAGDFILDEFEVSKANAGGTAVTDAVYNTYTKANAQSILENLTVGYAVGDTDLKNPITMTLADSGKYQIVALKGADATAAEAGTAVISATCGTAVTQAAIAADADLLSVFDVNADLTTTTKLYWTGSKWTNDADAAMEYELTDTEAAGKVVGADVTPDVGSVLKQGIDAANAASIKAGGATTPVTVPAVTTGTVETAAKPATLGTATYYIVTKASLAANPGVKDADIAGDGTVHNPTAYASGSTAPVTGEGYVVVDDVTPLVHYKETAASTVDYGYEYSFAKFTVTSTYTVNAGGWDKAANYTGNVDRYIPKHVGIGRSYTAVDTLAGVQETFYGDSAVSVATQGAYDMVKPMKSELSKPADVVASLKARKAGNKYYTSPITVLNDVIANNEEVSFKFVSSAAHIRNSTWVEVKTARKLADGTWVGTIVNPVTKLEEVRILPTTYTSTSPVGAGDCLVLDQAHAVNTRSGQGADTVTNWSGVVAAAEKAEQDWYNPVFNQHLYGNPSYTTDYSVNGTTYSSGYGFPLSGAVDGADATGVAGYATGNQVLGNYGSYNYGGWNTNLFNGGLVINSVWTMQLSDTKHFDWGQNSLTFFWSDIKSNTKTNADQFLVSMLLYTPVTWYWDTLEVGVGAAAAEGGNVAMGAGQEDDGAEIEEEEAVEEEIDLEEEEEEYFEEEEPEDEDFEEEEEYFEEEEPEDEYFEEFEEEEEEAPEEETTEEESTVVVVEEVASPKTGNSPIALAVIPVALAAAALVAKKKND